MHFTHIIVSNNDAEHDRRIASLFRLKCSRYAPNDWRTQMR